MRKFYMSKLDYVTCDVHLLWWMDIPIIIYELYMPCEKYRNISQTRYTCLCMTLGAGATKKIR